MGKLKKALFFVAKYAAAAVLSAFVFLGGFVSSRHRHLLTLICRHFGLEFHPWGPPLRRVELQELVPAQEPLQLVEVDSVCGNTSLYEVAVLCHLARAVRPKAVFEIGTFDGRTTINLALNTPRDCVVHTINLPKGAVGCAAPALRVDEGDLEFIERDVTGERCRRPHPGAPSVEGRVVQHFGDTATFDFGPWRGAVDMVFVDAAHSYEYVRQDSKTALSLLRGGKGVIAWHDYDAWDGVTRALAELQAERPDLQLVRVERTSLACVWIR